MSSSTADAQRGPVEIHQGNRAANTDNQEQQQNGAGPQQQQAQRNYWEIAKALIGRAIFMYVITSFLSNRNKAPTTPAPSDGSPAMPSVLPGMNLYPPFMAMDLYVYMSEKPKFYKFDQESLFWFEPNLHYGDWVSGPEGDGTFRKSAQLPVPEGVKNNVSNWFVHVYFVPAESSPNPSAKNHQPQLTLYKSYQLNKLKKVVIGPRKQNLLTGESKAPARPVLEGEEDDNVTTKIIISNHWHPNLTMNLVDDRTSWTKGRVPSPLSDYLEFNRDGNYLPILYFNDYWNLNKDYMPLNQTTNIVNFTLTYYPLSLWKWQLYVSQSMSNKWTKMLNGDFLAGDEQNSNTLSTDDNDSIKEALLDTNPILLTLTVVVSLLHTVFEFMAFKNDIQFWKNKGEDLEGLSVRSVFFNVVQSVIVLLYVLDNDTNPMVRLSIAVGLAIEIWKIKKVMNVTVDRTNKILGVIPRIHLEDKKSYVESSTRVYDEMAFKYLSWALFPLIIAYGIYSVLYEEHKGWYSWVLGMLYGFLLTFGFISMTPQLFINYKLKSVAHLPWRMMTYKALNTFIDDIFAFVIKMPTMYRIGCLRDDVIFFIFLYQRFIYRVDPSRVNEYGVSKEMLDKKKSETAEQQEDANGPTQVPESAAPAPDEGSVRQRRKARRE